MKTYNDILDLDTRIGISFDFPPIPPMDHAELINTAVHLFGESGLFLLIGRIESAGNDLVQTQFFIQSMQSLMKTNPKKVTEFQSILLSKITRIDFNNTDGRPQFLKPENLIQFPEFSYQPGILESYTKKDGSPISPEEAKTMGTILVYRLTVSALSEYVGPFVGTLMSSDFVTKISAILTDFLKPTPQTSNGSFGDQSPQDSSPQEDNDAKQEKRRSGIFTKRSK